MPRGRPHRADGCDAGAGDATAPASTDRIRGPARIGCRTGSKDRLPRPAPDAAAHRWYRRPVPIPRRYTTDAIVLSRFDLGEADRVLTLITPERRQAQGDRQGRPPADLAPRRQPRAVRGADRGARPRPDLRRRHPGQRRARLAQPARFARVGRDGLVPRRAGGPLARGAPRRRAAVRAAAARLRAARRAGWRRAASRAGTRCTSLDELGQRPEVDRCVECDRVLEADERFRWVPPLGGVLCERCPGPPHDRTRLIARGAQAAQGLPAPRHRGASRRSAWRRTSSARSRPRCATSSATRSSATRARCAFLDEVRHDAGARLMARSSCATSSPRRTAPRRWRSSVGARPGPLRSSRRAVVRGRDRRRPGVRPGCGPSTPRTGRLVGFVMISDGIPQARWTPTSSARTTCGGC